jgi:glycosyltransferase involved in cell wall biosynthesis
MKHSSHIYRVTAIVSTYKSALFIEGCLQDLISQTLYAKNEIEIIVIDSASPQNEGDIVKQYAKKHPHIVYLRTNERETLYAAWNRGIGLAHGKYITNANTDDRHRPDAFEILARTLDNNPDFGMAYGDCLITETNNETFQCNSAKSAYIFPACSTLQALARQFFGPQPMWHASSHEIVGWFDDSYTVQGDYDFFMRIAWKLGGIHVPELLGLYCRRPDSVERANQGKNVLEQAQVRAKYRKAIPIDDIYPGLHLYPSDPAARAACHVALGNLFIQSDGDTLNARIQYEMAQQLRPSHPTPKHNLVLCGILDKQHFVKRLNEPGAKPVPPEIYNALAEIPHNAISLQLPVKTGSLERPITIAIREQQQEKKSHLEQRTATAIRAFARAHQNMKAGEYVQAQASLKRYNDYVNYDQLSRYDNRRQSTPRFSVIIPAYKTGTELLKCLQALEAQSNQNFEIIVVDNGGNEACETELLNQQLLVIRTGINVFPSEARNIGAHFARGDILIFLDDDGQAHPNFIENTSNAFIIFKIKALRGKVLPKSCTDEFQHLHNGHYDLGNVPIPHYIGTEGCAAIEKKTYIAIGGMDPLLFGAEGLEISYRIASKFGLNSIIYHPEIILYHDYANSEFKAERKLSRHTQMHNYISAIYPGALKYMHQIRKMTNNNSNELLAISANSPDNALKNDIYEKLSHINWQNRYEKYINNISAVNFLNTKHYPSLSIIVISWRFNPDTLNNFKILEKQHNKNYELIFIDNGAKPEEFDCLTPYIDTYVRLNSNSGAYLARNIGCIFAKASILFFLDDDAIPANNIVESHLNCFKNYDVIAVRGVCKPKTNNPLNQLAKHYYLGPNPFPIFADIEGNTSYLASVFFKAGGWDDEIRFGGGGFDLSRRLLEIEPDMRKQIYSPDPIIFHDYALNSEQLDTKKKKQQESRNRLKIKHSDYDRFLTAWLKFTGRDDLLIKKNKQLCKIHDRALNTSPNKINDEQQNMIANNTFISICIPTYNREQYISETILSALEQNHENSEIIIIDDGSTDNTEIIVNSFASEKIKYFKKHHTNSPDTRNRCISEAKGDFILWLDSDDILAPNLILRFLNILNEYPGIDVCYGDIQPFGDLGSFSRKIIVYEDYYKKNAHLLSRLVLGNKIPNAGTFIRKDLYSKIGMYNTDFRRAHDYEFWIRCATVATFKHIGMTSLFWRWHETNMSAENKTYDTSFESLLLAKMIQDNSLQTLFPALEWSNQDTATLIARSELARMFIHWKDFESATSQLELGLKSILPDLATPKTEMKKLKFFEQTYQALFQSTQNDYFQKIGNIIGRTKISKENIACNIPRKINFSETTNPIISVIIPTYNRPEQLLTAVQSVREQSLTALEIIVINDCGVDVSKILQMLNDPRIVYIQHDNNKGLAASRNTGIRASKGIYIAYLDDDDRYFPHHLQTLINSLSNTQYKIAYSDSYRAYKFLDNGKLITIKKDCPYSIDFDKDLLLVKNIIPSNCIMHQKSCLDNIGTFDETLSSHEDWDLWIRLSREFIFLHVKEVTCEFSWRFDGSTMTSSGEDDYLQTRKIIYQRYEKYAINNTLLIEQQQKLIQKISKRQPLNVLTDKFFSKASIIIPTWNNALLTEQCLQAIIKNTNYPNFEIIIIDNGSKDGTEQLLRNLNTDIMIIKNTENLGFAKACNQGAMAAKGQYLVFLNNDTIPQKGWLTELISFMNLHPEAGIAGSKLLYPDDTIQHCGAAMRFDGKFFRHPYKYLHRNHPLVNQPRELDAVTAACFITPRELFFKLGKFDEHYLNGCEDMDYCTAVRRSGATIHYVPTSELYHLESQTPRPEDKDRENFQRYLKKWGKGAMQNEVEIYAKDGFWLQNGDQYSPSPNAVTLLKDLGLNFNPSCPTPADTFQKIVKRIFPLENWSKAD